LHFAKRKIPEKRPESLGKGTFVRAFPRGGIPGKTVHRKHLVRGYTLEKKMRG